MSEQIACALSDLPPGTARQAVLASASGAPTPVAVVRTDAGDVYAIGDVCSHGEVSLSEGELEGCEIECWAHGGRFDVRTGAAIALPAMSAVAAYPIRIDGEHVLVDVDTPILTKENA